MEKKRQKPDLFEVKQVNSCTYVADTEWPFCETINGRFV